VNLANGFLQRGSIVAYFLFQNLFNFATWNEQIGKKLRKIAKKLKNICTIQKFFVTLQPERVRTCV